jgi:hypothetical protein
MVQQKTIPNLIWYNRKIFKKIIFFSTKFLKASKMQKCLIGGNLHYGGGGGAVALPRTTVRGHILLLLLVFIIVDDMWTMWRTRLVTTTIVGHPILELALYNC